MAKRIVIEDFRLTVFAPRKLPEEEYEAMHQTLIGRRFRVRLRRAMRRVRRRYQTLSQVKVQVAW